MDLDLFVLEIKKLGLIVNDDMLSKLDKYYKLLVHYNSMMNLTAITDKKQVYLKHFYDSITIVKVLNFNKVSSLCDIGTGAGFPGIVLKIFFPHLKITLVDALGKRINFLNKVVSELRLDDVVLIHARAEDFACEARERFDVVVARAVSSLNILLELTVPLSSRYFIAMRGRDDSEVCKSAMKNLNCSIIKKLSFNLPFENSQRTIILFEKNGKTNLKYPRRFSIIKKFPL